MDETHSPQLDHVPPVVGVGGAGVPGEGVPGTGAYLRFQGEGVTGAGVYLLIQGDAGSAGARVGWCVRCTGDTGGYVGAAGDTGAGVCPASMHPKIGVSAACTKNQRYPPSQESTTQTQVRCTYRTEVNVKRHQAPSHRGSRCARRSSIFD